MDDKTARRIAWTPPVIPPLPVAPKSENEPTGEEDPDAALAELLASAECGMGCDYSDGPLSPEGARW